MDGPQDARDRWNDRYRSSSDVGDHARWLDELATVPNLIPEAGSVVDVAGGAGANARWFARRGHRVTVVDVSAVALDLVRAWADVEGLDVECVERDVEASGMPVGRVWDMAFMHLFFDRGVLAALPASLRPGGLLMVAQPTEVNLERHQRPGRRFLLAEGELAEAVGAMEQLEVVELGEAWRPSGRHEARLVARRTR